VPYSGSGEKFPSPEDLSASEVTRHMDKEKFVEHHLSDGFKDFGFTPSEGVLFFTGEDAIFLNGEQEAAVALLRTRGWQVVVWYQPVYSSILLGFKRVLSSLLLAGLY